MYLLFYKGNLPNSDSEHLNCNIYYDNDNKIIIRTEAAHLLLIMI